MKLKQIASNMTELTVNPSVTVFFSYETPVAARLAYGELVRTEEFYSGTTTKHINKWLNSRNNKGRPARTVSQSHINSLLKSAI